MICFGARTRKEAAAAFAAWWEKTGSTLRVGVYGAGYDFQMLCSAVADFRSRILAVADDSGAAGTCTVREMLDLLPDVVVVASLFMQEVMRRKLENFGCRGRILLPYRNDPVIGSLGLAARRPGRDWRKPRKNQSAKDNTPRRSSRSPGPVRRILLIQPPFDTANHRHKKTMPLGLLYVAAAIRQAFPDIRIRLIDAHIERLGWPAMQARLPPNLSICCLSPTGAPNPATPT